MTFQQLTYVVEIARCGSINKAAQNLYLSQSSISSAIKELEGELHIQLFHRSNRGVEFTAEGKEFLSYATMLLEQKQYIENHYSGENSSTERLSVSCQRYPFAEDAFARLIRQCPSPGYQFTLRETSIDSVIDDVFDGRSDLGIIFFSSLTERIIRRALETKKIDFVPLRAVEPCVFLGKEHPLAGRASLTPEDLAPYPFLAFEHTLGVSLDFSEEIHFISFQTPPRTVYVSDRGSAMSMLANTDCVTTGSGLLSSGYSSEAIYSIPLAGDEIMQLGWIRLSYRNMNSYAQQFLSLLDDALDDAQAHTLALRATMSR